MSLVAFLTGSAIASPGTPLPSLLPDHPRLLVTAADLPRLQQQVAAYPEEWQRVQSRALAPPEDGGLSDARTLVSTALAYLITREDRYLANAVALADAICRDPKPDGFVTPECIFSLTLCYDWCHCGLTESQRQAIREGVLRQADYLRDNVWRQSDTSNLFSLRQVWPFVYVGLALSQGPGDARAGEYLRTGADYLRDHLLPAANAMAGTTGGEAEGYGYSGWGFARPLALTLEAWRTATREDLFGSCTATRYDALWNLYGQRPFDRRLEHLDDASLGEKWRASAIGVYVYLLAARYRDPHAQWLGDQIPRGDTDYLWTVPLWRDPALSPRPLADLPTAARFDGLGWVLMRSSWEPDATFASFQCGPVLASHQHMDNNAFTIHQRALLALDSGVNAYDEEANTDYRANYYSRTIAHNTITVYDPNEKFPGGPWVSEELTGANDGGQLRRRGPSRIKELAGSDRWQVGQLLAYQHDPQFTYAVGDATRSYSSKKLSRFVRHFLFLPPRLFVVFDLVETTDPSFRKAWLLHTVDEPAVNGSVVTITNGGGRLTVRTLLPERPLTTTIGGPDKECWVDGKNWAPQEQGWARDAGAWRLEVSPSIPAKQDFFLHLLETDGAEIAAQEAVSLTRSPDQVGLRVRAQGKQYEVIFSSLAASAHLRIAEQGRTLLERDLH
jgi:hypothetical protein